MKHPESVIGNYGLGERSVSPEELRGFAQILGVAVAGLAVGVFAGHQIDPDSPWETGIGVGLFLGLFLLTCLAPGSPSG